MQCRTHEPVQLDPHSVDGGVGVQHFLLDTLIFVHNHHAGAALELAQSTRNAGKFIAEGVVQGEEVVDLGVEGWLGVRLVGGRWNRGERRGR